MDCNIAREALSARVDGEREPVPAPRVDEHLESCVDCREWYDGVVDQTLLFRRLAGRSHVASVPTLEATSSVAKPARFGGLTWPQVALAVVGVAQVAVALAQALGAGMGMPPSNHHAIAAEHLTNESTAWSLALGVAMIVAALRPVVAAGLASVLTVFTVVLAIYVVSDATTGAVTLFRVISHIPVLAGTVLALLMWRQTKLAGPEPGLGTQNHPGDEEDIVLPAHASRGRRKHLYPTDGAA